MKLKEKVKEFIETHTPEEVVMFAALIVALTGLGIMIVMAILIAAGL